MWPYCTSEHFHWKCLHHLFQTLRTSVLLNSSPCRVTVCPEGLHHCDHFLRPPKQGSSIKASVYVCARTRKGENSAALGTTVHVDTLRNAQPKQHEETFWLLVTSTTFPELEFESINSAAFTPQQSVALHVVRLAPQMENTFISNWSSFPRRSIYYASVWLSALQDG